MSQIQAYVFDVIRASVPKLLLDDVFEQKNEIAKAVEEELEKEMSAYGFEIVQTLIVDIEPDEHVKRAMNEINAELIWDSDGQSSGTDQVSWQAAQVSLDVGFGPRIHDPQKAGFAGWGLHAEEPLPFVPPKVIRASVPKLLLDDVFEQKNEIAKAVEEELEKEMSAYGFEIVQTLIVDIEPDEHVKRAMNEINAGNKTVSSFPL
ncbi:hypothetical protein Bca52824_089054 [Brassica carinata]|uniref:Band 7 domain-containing protein n=1 Tax=Brassica carinata TaxID=52824 RepID=A0A8X7TRE2_BRACI|nr:hypothetical protein Bca52824_089054 [Brassica carinata]